jgi:predicted permease
MDFRIAIRLLWRDRRFSGMAILTLGICLAANIAMFSVVNSVLLNPLPVPESNRLVLMYNSYPKAGVVEASTAVPDLFDRLHAVPALEAQALYRFSGYDVGERGNPERLRGMIVTPSFFQIVRVPAAIGRVLNEDDGREGQDRKVVLSHVLWADKFARDPAALGGELRVNGRPYTIVGVMPESFQFVEADVRLWIPAAFSAEDRSDERRHSNNWMYLGRLRPGATLEQAQSQVDALNASNLDRFAELKQILVNAGFHTVAVPFREYLVRDIRSVLYLLWGAVGFVLLIGCVNVANLALVRSTVRLRELATRMALGAGRRRIARQLTIEGLLLTVVAAALGIGLGAWTLGGFRALGLEELPRGAEIAIDRLAILFAGVLAVLVGAVIAGLPLAHVLRSNVNDVLREEGRSGSAGRRSRALRHTLVAAEVALAFLLLVGAGLLLASFQRVLRIDPGFDPGGVMTAAVALPASRYADDAARAAFVERALREVRGLPGVRAAGVTSTIPFGGNYSDSVILAEGYAMRPGESLISPSRVTVSPGYFEAMGMRVLRGRDFDARDAAAATRTVIVDEQLAKRFWPDRDPIGRRLYMPDTPQDLVAPGPTVTWLTVVGVVETVTLQDLVRREAQVGAYYFPFAQAAAYNITFAVKSDARPESLLSAVRARINAIDPEMPVYSTWTMEERLARSLTGRRTPLVLALGFGGIAVLLSAIGIYGVLSYLVAQRTREIGIRMALGGTPRDILRLVIREGLTVVGLGFAVGLAGAIALRRVVESQLYGVQPTDLAVYAGAVIVLGFVAFVACLLPAWRAARVNPALALGE